MQSIYTNGILLDHRRNGVLIHTTRMSLENIMPSLKNQSQNTMSSTILFIFPEQGNLFPGGSEGQESACNAGDLGSTPRSGRSPGEGNGNPLQYSCLEYPMDRVAWQTTAHGITKSQTRLSYFTSSAILLSGCTNTHSHEQ